MDLDSAAIWYATQGESQLKKLKELGVTVKMLNGEAKAAWRYIETYRDKYSQIPTAGTVVDHTQCAISPPVDIEAVSIEYVVDQLYERAELKALQYGLGKSHEAFEKGDQKETVTEVLKLADHLRSAKAAHLQIRTIGEIAPEVLELYELVKSGKIGVPFPWSTMTAMTLGMWPGTLTFFVARPGVGKTWTAVVIALHAWKEGKKRVLIVSPELGRVELGERIVAKHGQHAYGNLVSAQLGDMGEKALREDVAWFVEHGKGLWVLDNEEKLGPEYIEQAIDATDPELVVIDSLYMLRVEDGKVRGAKGDNRQDRVVNTIEWMRRIARSRNLPVVGIHQLSRDGTMKRDTAKSVKSGKGTGGLENTVALSDALFWYAHNLFAMFQDDYMRQDKQLMYVPLKARRQVKLSSLVISWNLETMNFTEIGTRVVDGERSEEDGYKDDDGDRVPY